MYIARKFIYLIAAFLFVFLSAQSSKNEKEVLQLIKLANQNKNTNGQKAIALIQDALKKSKSISDHKILIQLYESTAQIYFSQGIYDQSLKYFNEELAIMNQINSKKKYIPLTGIGNVYNSSKDSILAKKYYENAIDEIKKASPNKMDATSYIVYNNLAVLEQKSGNFKKALRIYQEVKNTSLKIKDTTGLIMAYQNLGLLYFEMKNFPLGFENTAKAESLAKIKKSTYDLALIYYNLGYVNTYLIGNAKDAKINFIKSYNIGNKQEFTIIKLMTSIELSNLYEKEGDFKSANYYLRINKQLTEDKLKKQSKEEFSILELKYKQKIIEDAILEDQKQRNILYVASIVGLILTLIILFLVYQLQKYKIKKQNIENNLLIYQLEKKNKEITEKSLKALQTNEILDSTSKKLLEIKENTTSKNQQLISQIINDLKNDSGGFNHLEFDKVFKETNEDFYRKIIQKFPNLTRNEIRLCAFLKMNLSSKEISAITQQSYNSITIARHRLRKKMNLDESQNLTTFLLGFTINQ